MKNCLYCGKPFEEKKDSAKYCSASCRVMYNRNKKDKSTKMQASVIHNQIMDALEETKELRRQIVSDLFMFGQARTDGKPLIEGFGPNTTFEVIPAEEPLSFDKIREEVVSKPTYLQLLNGMANVHFSDEKEDYALKIHAATHLPDKQRNDLLNALKLKQ